MSHQFSIRFILLTGLFGVLHVLATQYYLYWYLSWFDLIMHLLGGVLLILGLGTLVEVLPRSWTLGWWRRTIVVSYIIAAIVVWEILGVVINQGFKPDWLVDTIGDVMFSIIGTIVGYWWSKQYIQYKI